MKFNVPLLYCIVILLVVNAKGSYTDMIDSFCNSVTAFVTAYPLLSQSLDSISKSLPSSVAKFPFLDYYVSRPYLEDTILQIYNNSEYSGDSYSVVVGIKGAGKSSLIAHVLDKKSGVVYYSVNDLDTPESIVTRLLWSSGQKYESNLNGHFELLFPVFQNAAKSMNGRKVTLVLDLERGTTSEPLLTAIKLTAKMLGAVANVIVVVSDANAGTMTSFGDDHGQTMIWVGGMTEAEATTLARLIFPLVSDIDLRLLFDQVTHHERSEPFIPMLTLI